MCSGKRGGGKNVSEMSVNVPMLQGRKMGRSGGGAPCGRGPKVDWVGPSNIYGVEGR